MRCFEPQQQPLTVAGGPATLNFTLTARTDSFGYTCKIVTPSYTEVDNVVTLNGGSASLSLPFAFSFYGQSYTTAFVWDDGVLHFVWPGGLPNSAIPNAAAPNAAIYPFWDNLFYCTFCTPASSIRTGTVGAAPNRRFVVEWRNMYSSGGATETFDFELMLFENGQIQLHYRNMNPADGREQGNSATIGIENQTGSVAFQYAFNEAVLSDAIAMHFQVGSGSPPPTATPTATFTPTPTPTHTPTPTPTATPIPGSDLLYVSSTTNGSAGGVSFADEDILAYDTSTGLWFMVYDGSDVSGGTDVNAFAFLNDGSILLSFDAALTLSGAGAVDDSDIVRFVPTSLGGATAGTFELYLDGSDVGLSTNGEDIDALHVLDNGDLIISTFGSFAVTGASGNDEDLIRFTPTTLGSTTSGAWSLHFDGSDVGLNESSSEAVYGVSIDEATGDIYLTTADAFSVTGLSGDGADVFICAPGSLGDATSCTFSLYWDGSLFGYTGEVMDAVEVVLGGASSSLLLRNLTAADANDAAINDPHAVDEGNNNGE